MTMIKELKNEIKDSMAELKTQSQLYIKVFSEWCQVKEEWLSLAADEENLSDRAEWCIESSIKHLKPHVDHFLQNYIQHFMETHPVRNVYAALQPALDSDYSWLTHHASVLMEHTQYLGYIDERIMLSPNSEGIKNFQDSAFFEALYDIQRYLPKFSDLKQGLMAISGLTNTESAELVLFGTPHEELMYLDDYVVNYLFKPSFAHNDKARSIEKCRMPESANYRLYEKFEPLPDFAFDSSSLGGKPKVGGVVNKVLGMLNQSQLYASLQSELQNISKQTHTFKVCVSQIEQTILRIKSEVSEMQKVAQRATQELHNGKHFNDWLRSNLGAELKSIGLDAENATFQDLMNTFGQEVSEPPNVQEYSLEM